MSLGEANKFYYFNPDLRTVGGESCCKMEASWHGTQLNFGRSRSESVQYLVEYLRDWSAARLTPVGVAGYRPCCFALLLFLSVAFAWRRCVDMTSGAIDHGHL